MCGIAGFLSGNQDDWRSVDTIAASMGHAIIHRGPDDSGVWASPEENVCLVQRRLSIVDLSDAGHQPMHSASGRYTLVFNGEIYNHQTLRIELEQSNLAPDWRGRSDTETIVACFDAFGLETALCKFVGMFAIAVFDRNTNSLFLARDRMGEKPLYYGTQQNRSFFASELKSIKAHPGFRPQVNRDALCLYLRHNYIPAPYSVYTDINKLRPGYYVNLSAGSDPICYWSFDAIVEQGKSVPYTGGDQEIIDHFDDILRSAVGLQMQADVPLGAFLSGGIDSSLIVALMQEQSVSKIKTFSIGFKDERFNEAPYAKAVSQHIGTDHRELYVEGRQALDVIPKLPSIYDEPFSDSSQIPTFLVSELARAHVKVSLSGDAGDELFAGYNRYLWGDSVQRKLGALPFSVRGLAAKIATSLAPKTWDGLLKAPLAIAPQSLRFQNPGDKIHKMAGILRANDPMELYRQLISHWDAPDAVVKGGNEPCVLQKAQDGVQGNLSFVDAMMHLDSVTYLPDDILVKVDRAAMSVSLETRVPFLDHRVVEAAWKLPAHMKVRGGDSKWILRQLLYQRVPKDLIERPKIGFGVPLDSWLRGPLRDWCETLLEKQTLDEAGFFNSNAIRKKWSEHLSGSRNWSYHLWDVLMFEAWRQEHGL